MPLLVILFIVVPIAELYVIVQIGSLIGVLPTLGLLLADALLGSLLLRQQGRGAWRRFNEAIAAHRFPGREVADGLMIAIGGTLLLTPGFITDIFGLILLIPPSRGFVRRAMRPLLMRRFRIVGVPGHGRGDAKGRPYDLDATAQEVPPDDPRLPG